MPRKTWQALAVTAATLSSIAIAIAGGAIVINNSCWPYQFPPAGCASRNPGPGYILLAGGLFMAFTIILLVMAGGKEREVRDDG